jgi:hypothetical protein
MVYGDMQGHADCEWPGVMPGRLVSALLFAAAFLSISTGAAAGQAGPPAATPETAVQPAATPQPSPAPPSVELDQMVINSPTTMPLRRHKSYFRITHRFARDLRRGPFSSLAEDLFSLDNGAIIGLEYRFGIADRLQAGVHRSILGKTIVTFARWDPWRQADGRGFGLSATGSIEGQNNLHLDPQPGISATLSRIHGTRLALYATPTFIKDAHTETLRVSHGDHTHETPGETEQDEGVEHNSTAFVGLGMRARVRETVSLVAEVSPRIWGYRPARAAWSVGIEKLTRGHVMQLNIGNSFGTTPGQVARGGSDHDVYLGFSMSRKF